jgi:poly-beta-1,6-N-acetyl-D-glucosamine synthase
MKVITKLWLSIMFSVLWVGVSIWVGMPWFNSLANEFGTAIALIIFCGVAALPGSANAFLLSSLLLDKKPRFDFLVGEQMPNITILIAAFNEEKTIKRTLHSLNKQDYLGNIEIIVIDDGSSDDTSNIVSAYNFTNPNIKRQLITLPKNAGKANALNTGLQEASYDIIVTVDADSFIFQNSLKALVSHLVKSPDKQKAVAGTVLSRNYKSNKMTKLQQWDYYYGIGVVKKVQSLYQGTLVAQGAFSAYYTDVLKEIGGWPDLIGEDIVLTWTMRKHGYEVGYSDLAICFTNTPTSFRAFLSQRSRWAIGLLQAFRYNPEVIWRVKKNSPLIWYNMTFPFLDASYLFIFFPGVIAAVFFGYYEIAGLYTLALLPLTAIIVVVQHINQQRSLHEFGLHPKKGFKNYLGLCSFILFYQLLLSYASVVGYLQFIFNSKRGWK